MNCRIPGTWVDSFITRRLLPATKEKCFHINDKHSLNISLNNTKFINIQNFLNDKFIIFEKFDKKDL